MSAPTATPGEGPGLAHVARPALLEAVRFYLFAGASVVLAVLLVVMVAIDATR